MSEALDERQKGVTLEEIRERCLHWTEDKHGRRVIAGSAYNRLFLRRISVRVTRFFLRVGIRANTATVLMMIAGVTGIACCVPHLIVATLAGAACYFLFDLMDAVDGEIARWNGSSSTKGLYLDKVSHLLVGYPSLGVPAFHYYGVHQNALYLVLAGVAMMSGLMGYTLREIFFRINAETALRVANAEPTTSTSKHQSPSLFHKVCGWLKSGPVTSFPITKARVVHILTICAILATYQDMDTPLRFLAWFYAGYCSIRLAIEIPYFYHNRVIDVRHEKQVRNYRWPI